MLKLNTDVVPVRRKLHFHITIISNTVGFHQEIIEDWALSREKYTKTITTLLDLVGGLISDEEANPNKITISNDDTVTWRACDNDCLERTEGHNDTQN